MSRKTTAGKITIGQDRPLCLIAGPCVIEDADTTFEIARRLKHITEEAGCPFIFKASYDKANRTSIQSFRGPGLEEGLDILNNIKATLDVHILSDVHRSRDVAMTAWQYFIRQAETEDSLIHTFVTIRRAEKRAVRVRYRPIPIAFSRPATATR